MKIKAILFDAGGVYLKGSVADFVNKSSKMLGVKKRFKISKVFFCPDLNKGKITIEKCFEEYFNIPFSKNQMKKLIKLWNSTWIADKDMIRILKILKKNYKLAIFSNSDYSNDKIYRKKGWYDYFDYLILSHKLGVIKPDKKIYRIAIKKLRLKPQELLFIDDQKDCLIPAKELGMKTLMFESPSRLRRDLRKMEII